MSACITALGLDIGSITHGSAGACLNEAFSPCWCVTCKHIRAYVEALQRLAVDVLRGEISADLIDLLSHASG